MALATHIDPEYQPDAGLLLCKDCYCDKLAEMAERADEEAEEYREKAKNA